MKNLSGWLWLASLSAISSSYAQAPKSHPLTSEPVRAIADKLKAKLVPGSFYDEAMHAAIHQQVTAKQLNALYDGSHDDYFRDMDDGITQSKNRSELAKRLDPFLPKVSSDELRDRVVKGRNNWMVWTGGNDRFWDYMTEATFGSLDFIKTVSNHPALPATRDNRWIDLGLVNEPCFEKATGPDPQHWGLWLDKRTKNCEADPYADEKKYPGIKLGARGNTLNDHGVKRVLPVGSFYGEPTGVLGLRLFPNPDFDQKAADRWDPKRYYEDPNYFNDPKLVRPYRVGMACAFCHVGPSPVNPPKDFNNPEFKNLNANVGAQYFWIDRIFYWNWKDGRNNFIYQLLHTSRPGSLDTSLISSDQINNPRTMNAVYSLGARAEIANRFEHRELLTGPELYNKQFQKFSEKSLPNSSPLRASFNPANNTVISPRILKDGSDSVGILGALNRVYVNIGLFSEEWIQNFIPLLGGKDIKPFKISIAQNNSLYWNATTRQTPDLAYFFLATAKPDHLKDAPGGNAYFAKDSKKSIEHGKEVFAEHCASCHSSKLPEKAYTFFSKNDKTCNGKDYMSCWNDYWSYTKSDEFISEMKKLASKKDFLENNYLSTDLRIPSTLLDTQLCSPVATNAIEGDIWDNFSATSYKNLPSSGTFIVNYPHPTKNVLVPREETVPAGGRGYIRPPSLASAWSTAPFLGNNALGKFDPNGTLAGRMDSFNDSIEKLLNPELRGQGAEKGMRVMEYTSSFGSKLPGIIDVTSQKSYLKLPLSYIPKELWGVVALVKKPVNDQGGAYLMLGPIPAGVPVNLITNINLASPVTELLVAVTALVKGVNKVVDGNLDGDSARRAFMEVAGAPLLKVSKCRDFVVNRGHYFGTDHAKDVKDGRERAMTADDKKALIEFIKTM